MKMILAVALILAPLARAQDAGDQDKLLLVPKRYLSQDAINHAATAPVVEASKWVGFGKEVGQAMNEGLGAVVNQADKFGTTKVGIFVMGMIAWKVLGDDLKDLVFGLPVCLLGVILWIWSYRKFFTPSRILIKQDGKAKEWKVVHYEFETHDGRSGCVAIHACFLAAWLLIWVFKIF